MSPELVWRDIQILEEEIFLYRRKLNKLASTVNDAHMLGQTMPQEECLQVWTALNGANKLLKQRWKQYKVVSSTSVNKLL